MEGNGTLVDSNVLLDIIFEDVQWCSWSEEMLRKAADAGPLLINQVIYAEVSASYKTIEELESRLPADDFVRSSIPWEAAFLAGKCFLRYKRAGGTRRSPLPDFFIGAHAAVSGLYLLTRDATRYRTYFPGIRLISPN
jgi:hypothetical protein